MLDPWKNWPGLSDAAVGAVAEQQRNRGFRAAVDSIEVANQAAGRASHYTKTSATFTPCSRRVGAV